MRTERVPAARDVELAVDRWDAEVGADRGHATRSLPPFVLVHGLASNARMWDGVAAALTHLGHDVTTVDLRGHGRSSKPDSGYEVGTVADDLAHLIDALALDRPIVAGQSWGGNVAVELAARHQNSIRGLVCVDGGGV